ncbi:MAG: 3-isopropylmalate dehydratase small subunit [Immundisolibacter sp.]|uniref:3-isopropylmalate dehydratase small subunit n=1 Tax=Immundisolibacter sp. TaxID=1934948 RepID=UPI003EDF8B2B
MDAFTSVIGVVLPIDRANVDTDAIIPKQFLKSVKRSGFGPNLFDEWRYLDHGEPNQDCSGRPLNPDFVLNQPRYRDAQVVLARRNFGCGSSREHAVWALVGYGIRAVIAPSFAEIFYNNAFKNGLLPVILAEDVVDRLFGEVKANEGYRLTVDLEALQVRAPDGQVFAFELEADRRHRLLNGLDDIALTLGHADAIRAYEAQRATEAPWLFPDRVESPR